MIRGIIVILYSDKKRMQIDPDDYPEFDPIVLKYIHFMHIGDKESRRALKELYHVRIIFYHHIKCSIIFNNRYPRFEKPRKFRNVETAMKINLHLIHLEETVQM